MIPMTSTYLIKFRMGTCHGSVWPGHQIDLKNSLMLKILGVSDDLNNILDEPDTILDDP